MSGKRLKSKEQINAERRRAAAAQAARASQGRRTAESQPQQPRTRRPEERRRPEDRPQPSNRRRRPEDVPQRRERSGSRPPRPTKDGYGGSGGNGGTASGSSKLQEVLDRGYLIVGTGSTNAPWHFYDDNGNLCGFDVSMAKIVANSLFGDPEKVKFVEQSSDERVPNLVNGNVVAEYTVGSLMK